MSYPKFESSTVCMHESRIKRGAGTRFWMFRDSGDKNTSYNRMTCSMHVCIRQVLVPYHTREPRKREPSHKYISKDTCIQLRVRSQKTYSVPVQYQYCSNGVPTDLSNITSKFSTQFASTPVLQFTSTRLSYRGTMVLEYHCGTTVRKSVIPEPPLLLITYQVQLYTYQYLYYVEDNR